ncbi:trypsin-like peptidase domain-containing protein [Achromobacter xylosoxidans]|uniref:PDZ domain-containing protein n=1 Tax=Alcaligenes xylosoxydans xylosoxydans TaxID=85698 RepID=A0A424W9A8_ALCXX|nr:trypsin-like peptidase domain-containing protein [Achromobacter xylosoxidans]MBC9907253.1 trypsin-like peptidase domain-containing protein [Achromobacter xylosoxidans]MBD0870752.1 trypsin-like peptidase domain-containing protein [Achromobacter xylosoxidans]QNP86095.1 trypsin-like peptidase domain-containing protein [Achromobacter xylosoxidans]RPJ89800.1 PDZ domain-containing protein [Achromobacter xylosoxidans]
MRRYWLIFAQAVTVCLGILFVVTTLRPDLLRLAGPAAGPQSAAAAARPPVARAQATASYADGVARAAPSVVNVYTTKHVNVPLIPLPDDPVLRQFFGQVPGVTRRQASTSLGSGVIVNQDGYVLTNYHVVQAAEAIEVALSDGRRDTAKVVGADPDTDLAVLKLATLRSLPAATLAPDRGLRVGDVVLAIGNPFGVGQTTTLGIVSALGRNGLGLNTYENFIQTDAAINPGNSGGALVDAAGNLVGINTAIYSESGGSMGIGFATPIEIARKVMDEIVKTGAVKRGWLGVEPQDVTPELARAFGLDRDTAGVIIAGVMRDGPAARGGLRVGDIVQSVNGKRMMDTASLLSEIAQLPPGQSAKLGILRSGKPAELAVVVGTRPGKPR